MSAPATPAAPAWRPGVPSARSLAVWIALLAAVVVGFVLVPAVVAPERLPVLLRQAAPLGVVALGQTVLILGRGFDLSVGGVVALVNVVAAGSFASDASLLTVGAACLGVGVLVGAVNGAVIAFARISPFVMTLGMAFVLTGVVLVYTGGQFTRPVPQSIRSLSSERVLGLPIAVLIWLVLGLVLALLLRRTWLGHYVYARGSAPDAARTAGVRVAWLDFGSYVLCSTCAALGGLLLAGFVGTSSLGAGQDLLLGSIAAVVVGGTTFEGGRGGVVGSIGGAMLLTLITALLTGAGVAKQGNLIVQGAVLIVAAALFRSRRSR